MVAFETLVERHRDEVYGFGLRMTRSETDAADIAQESFLSAYFHLNEFQNEDEFGAWIHWIAARRASIRLRLLRKAQAAEWKLESPMFHARGALAQCSGADWSRDADERALSAELHRAVEDATDLLPPSHREVFLFRDMAGLSYEQIAGITGESAPAIKSRLHQARLSLRETIDRFYNER
jgi:RNA polymerase sigma-70 factor (ECF subfamily)